VRGGLSIALRTTICAALVLLFLWPAIYNRQPLFSPDTGAYIRGFDAGVVWLSGRTSAWTSWASKLADQQPNDATVKDAKSLQSPEFIIAGRSVLYGALLYLGELLGGLWASIAIQAAAALAALGLALKHLKLFSWPTFVITASAVGLASSLPFVASFLLPDIFAGLSILGAAIVLALGDRLMPRDWVFWISILGAAVVVHPSHLAVVVVFLIGAIAAKLLTKKLSLVGILTLALAAAIGFASETGFALVVEKLLGVSVSRPPVIMARMVADGPGSLYLREKCPQAGLVVCEFVDRLAPNSDAFLWSAVDKNGVYIPAPPEKRRALGNEQYRFAVEVLAYDPLGQLTAGLDNTLQQLTMTGLSDFIASVEQAIPNVPKGYAEQMAESAIGQKTFPIKTFSTLVTFSAVLSFIFIFITLATYSRILPTEEKLFYWLILLGQVANAFICGALSGPHERYQSRLTWLLPAVALVAYFQTWLRSEKGRSTVSDIGRWAAAGRLQPATTAERDAFRSFRSAFRP